MRGYAQYCPIAKGSAILGDRWTLLIVREILGGASGFNELQRGLPGISRSVPADRLRFLERAEILERRTGPWEDPGHQLTLADRDLEAVVQAIGEVGRGASGRQARVPRQGAGRVDLLGFSRGPGREDRGGPHRRDDPALPSSVKAPASKPSSRAVTSCPRWGFR